MSMQLLHNTVFWVNSKYTEFGWKRSLFINVTLYKVNKVQRDSEILPMSSAQSRFYECVVISTESAELKNS